MTKENWINALKSGDQEVVNFLFKYYKNKGGKGTPQQFSQMFPFLNMENTVSKLNAEFEVTVLVSKEGLVINYF